MITPPISIGGIFMCASRAGIFNAETQGHGIFGLRVTGFRNRIRLNSKLF